MTAELSYHEKSQQKLAMLAALKPGDKVAVINCRSRYFISTDIVTRVTKTKIFTGIDTAWKLSDGFLCGGGTWSSKYIEPFTDEHQKEIDAAALNRFLHAFLRAQLDRWTLLDNETLGKLAIALGWDGEVKS